MADEAPEITAARVQAAGAITAALIRAHGGNDWIGHVLGGTHNPLDAAGAIYGKVLGAMLEQDPHRG